MIPRTLFSPEHETFRDSVRRFLQDEVAPHDERWQEQGYVDKEVWKKAGANGFLCCSMPEEYGGSGADKLYSVVLMEEQAEGGDAVSRRHRAHPRFLAEFDRVCDGGHVALYRRKPHEVLGQNLNPTVNK